ncbi:uroporphyrinogen-III synthase [Vibrio ponticus]|nr:uroporphyrinogen-III synthase [Vibrio ponticus]
MAVLVTRPGKQGLALCRQLQQHGIKALHHPLITIQAGEQLSSLIEQLPAADIIIAVSNIRLRLLTKLSIKMTSIGPIPQPILPLVKNCAVFKQNHQAKSTLP